MHENLWQWLCRMGRVWKLRASRSVQRLVLRYTEWIKKRRVDSWIKAHNLQELDWEMKVENEIRRLELENEAKKRMAQNAGAQAPSE